jgi:hypothetical protein
MFQRLLSVFVVAAVLFAGAGLAGAATEIPKIEGFYNMFGGKIKIDLKSGMSVDLKAQVPKYSPLLDVSATIYDSTLFLAGFLLGGGFEFGPGYLDPPTAPKYLKGPMTMGLGATPYIGGTYKQEVDSKGNLKNNKFAVDVDMQPIIDQLKQMLVDQLGEFFEVEVEQTKGVMAGTYLKKKVYYKGIYDPAQDKKVGTCSFSGAFSVYWPSKASPLLIVSLTMASQPTTMAMEPPDEEVEATAAVQQGPAPSDTMKEILETAVKHIVSVVKAYQAQ